VIIINSKQKVLEFLQNNIRYSYNAKTIYRHLKGTISESTIRQNLRRLYEEKQINKIDRGFYQAKVNKKVLNILERPPTLLHAITICCDCPKLQISGQGAKRHSYKKEILNWLKYNEFEFTSYNKNKPDVGMHIKRFWFSEDRDATVSLHSNGRMETFIGCSKHPINYLEFRDILNNIEGRMSFLSPFENQIVTQIGINKDYRQFDLSGIRSLKLKEYSNAWFQIYKKESIGSVRFESHIAPKLDLKDAFQILESLSNGYKSEEIRGYV